MLAMRIRLPRRQSAVSGVWRADRRRSIVVAGWPWLFLDPPKTEAITTIRVVDDRLPILIGTREHDGFWQFLCGTTMELASLRMTTLGEFFRRDPSIAVVHDLKFGWVARRESPTSPWVRHRYVKP